MVIPNHLLVHAGPLRQCGLPVTRAHAPHSRHVVRRISSAVPPAPLKARSPHRLTVKTTKHDEDANSPSLGRSALCLERFLASLFRCSSASAESESAKHFSLVVINRTNVLKICLPLRPLQQGLHLWSFHLLPGFDKTAVDYPPQLRVVNSLSDQAALSSHFMDHTCLRSVIVLLQTLSFNSKLQFQLRFFDDTCTNRSTRDLNVSFSRFVETDTALDTAMHDLAHDLVHPDRQDNHKIHYCLRQISDARVGVSLLVFPQAPSLSASALSLAKAFPMLLLKMLILPRRFEKLVLHVAHVAGELRLQVHNHLLRLVGMRTLELLQVIPRRGMNSFHMSLPSLSMSMPLNKWFAQLDLFRGIISASPLSTLRAWRPSRICNAIVDPLLP